MSDSEAAPPPEPYQAKFKVSWQLDAFGSELNADPQAREVYTKVAE
jgi:hypothetical protein